MITLYHHWLSPPSRFIRVLLDEKRVPYRMRLEKEWERRPEFMKLNPAGEVPVLILENNQPYSGVMAIAEYLEEVYPAPEMLTTDTEERYEIRRLMGWFHSKISAEVTRHIVSEKLFKRFLRMGEPDSEAIRCASHNLRIHLEYITWLAERRHYLAGSQFTMADAAAAAHISVIDYFGDIVWADWPVAKEWYMRVKSRRSVRGLLIDRVTGLQPPAHYEKLDF